MVPPRMNGKTPFWKHRSTLACRSGSSPDFIRFLLHKGANVEGSRALFVAAKFENLNALRVLVEEGAADVNTVHDSTYEDRDESSGTALHMSAKEGQGHA